MGDLPRVKFKDIGSIAKDIAPLGVEIKSFGGAGLQIRVRGEPTTVGNITPVSLNRMGEEDSVIVNVHPDCPHRDDVYRAIETYRIQDSTN